MKRSRRRDSWTMDPPLRSFDWPDGLPHNAKKAWKQTHTGSILMRFLISIMVALAKTGGISFLEHPAFPVWAATKRPSSVWSRRAIRLLKRLHCIQVTTLDQCLFGCKAKKPTTLMTLRLPSLRKCIMARGNCGRCNHPFGMHQALHGRDESGAFHTA